MRLGLPGCVQAYEEDGEEKREKEVRESEGLRDKGEKVEKARMGTVGLGTTTKAGRGAGDRQGWMGPDRGQEEGEAK